MQTLTFVWGAANLALQSPYDTVQLQAIPHTFQGKAVPTAVVHYSTPDSVAIRVSPTGLVTALKPIALTHVIASVVTPTGRTITDTARIQVTPTPLPAPLVTLSIQPRPGGLANTTIRKGRGQFTVPFFATMATGAPSTDTLCNAQGCLRPLLVRFMSSEPQVASIDAATGKCNVHFNASVTITVSTIAYGVRKIDSLHFESSALDQRTTANLYMSSLQPAVMSIRPDPKLGVMVRPPYYPGLVVFLTTSTDESVEVRLPDPAHGVRFGGEDRMHWSPQTCDTLAPETGKNWMQLMFDSVGTYVLRYRGLKTGAVLSDTMKIIPYPYP